MSRLVAGGWLDVVSRGGGRDEAGRPRPTTYRIPALDTALPHRERRGKPHQVDGGHRIDFGGVPHRQPHHAAPHTASNRGLDRIPGDAPPPLVDGEVVGSEPEKKNRLNRTSEPAMKPEASAAPSDAALVAFHTRLMDLPGFGPTPEFWEDVQRKYMHLDLLTEATKMVSWWKEHRPGQTARSRASFP
jgi:hypothetical protein